MFYVESSILNMCAELSESMPISRGEREKEIKGHHHRTVRVSYIAMCGSHGDHNTHSPLILLYKPHTDPRRHASGYSVAQAILNCDLFN